MAHMAWGALVVAVATLGRVAEAEPSAADKRRAGELAAQSAVHYKRGEFEIAAALLKQAYALYPEPNLLYNLGRTLEKQGDLKGAIEAYQRFLVTATSIDDRPAIERHLAELEAKLPPEPTPEPKAQPKEPAPPAPRPAPPPPAVVVVARPVESPSVMPWITIGAGVAIAGAGGGAALYATNRHDAAVHATVGTTAQALQDTASHYALAANVMFAVGGAVAIAGIVWRVRAGGGDHGAVTATVGPGAVGVAWTF